MSRSITMYAQMKTAILLILMSSFITGCASNPFVRQVTLTVTSAPSGADIYDQHNGTYHGKTPVTLTYNNPPRDTNGCYTLNGLTAWFSNNNFKKTTNLISTCFKSNGVLHLTSDVETPLTNAPNKPSIKEPTQPPITTEKIEANKIHRKLIASGTCFFVSKDGHLITNQHVIDEGKYFEVQLNDGTLAKAKLKKNSTKNDLAILKLENVKTPFYLSLEYSRNVSLGDEVFTIGFPLTASLGKEAKFTDGSISSKSGLDDDQTTFQMTVPIQSGNSGGPLVNNEGRAIGIVTSSASASAFMKKYGRLPQNINWAVKADYAIPLLDEVPIMQAKTSSRKEAIKKTEKAVCRIFSYD